MSDYSITWNAQYEASVTSVSVGDPVVIDGNGQYLPSTKANRVALGNRKTSGIARSPVDGTSRAGDVQHSGLIPAPAFPTLGPGTDTFVIVADDGTLARSASPSATDDVIGTVDTHGNLTLTPGRTSTSTTSGGAVADDIAKSGIDFIDRVRGFRAVPLAGNDGDHPPVGGAWAYTQVGTNSYKADNPTPKGWYDPRHYGAKFDGQTDDILALEAMMAAIPETGGYVHWPPTLAWISRTFIIQKPVKIFGQGGNDARCGGLWGSPGRTVMEMQSVYIASLGGSGHNGADYGEVHGFNVESQILIAPDTSRGSIGGGQGINTMNTTHKLVRNGDCYVRPGNTAPNVCFRAQTPTAAAVDTDGSTSIAVWSNTLGAVSVPDAYGIVWTTESVPSMRADLTAYVVGQRVFGFNDNRYMFECTTAGTTAASPPADFSSGPYGRGATTCIVGGTITDGSVVWTVHIAAGIYVNASQVRLEKIYGYKLTNYILHVQGGTGMDARSAATDSNNVRIDNVKGAFCGGVLYLAGDNCNGWTVHGVDGLHMGTYHPAATLFLPNGGTLPYPNGGRGGHILFDASQGGGNVFSSYGQLSTGIAVIKKGAGRTSFIGCFSEITQPCYFTNGPSWIIGGNLPAFVDPASILVQVIDSDYGQGISEVDRRVGTDLHVALLALDGQHVNLRNRLNDSSQGGMACRYNDGWWTERYYTHGPSPVGIDNDAFEVSTAPAGLDPGPGVFAFRKGYYLGRPGTDAGAVFRGHNAALTSNLLRAGLRKTGDQFTNGGTTIQMTSDGYRAIPWAASGATFAATAGIGQRAEMCEPTTNTGTSAGGEKVFKCTTAGTRGGMEPSWVGATMVNDTVTDGSVVWTLVGFTPSWTTVGGGGGGGEANTASNLGAGSGLYATKVGVDLEFKSLIAGTNVSFVVTGTDITISAAGGGGGGGFPSVGGAGQVNTSDGAGGWLAPSNVLAGANFISIGASPAATGALRLPNNLGIQARDTGATDRSLLFLNNADQVVIGAAGIAGDVIVRTDHKWRVSNGSINPISADGTNVYGAVPFIGDVANNSPYGTHGDTAINVANVDYTLSAAEAANHIIVCTSSPAKTNVRAVKFPTPAAGKGYTKVVRAVYDGSGNDFKFMLASGAGYNVEAGGVREVNLLLFITSDGVLAVPTT